MWVREFTGTSTASPARVFDVLADAGRWAEWNDGVAAIDLHGPFAAGTSAVMVFPGGGSLPFRLTWVEPGKGYEDLTEMPDDGVAVRVRHTLEPSGAGTRVTYRCQVDGPDSVAAEVGAGVTADFTDVIAALAARAERPGA